MFYLSWALKNLFHNRKRSAETVLFIAIISAVFFLNLAFLKGSRIQMEETLEEYVGDIGLDAKSEDYNLEKIREELETGRYRNAVKTIVGEYSLRDVRLISNNAYLSDGKVEGYTSNYFGRLNNMVEWMAGGDGGINKASCAVIERETAADLGVTVGDNVTVELKTRDGAINTATFRIIGVFIGNIYVNSNTLYVGIENARTLGMVSKNYLNHIRVFLKHPDDNGTLRSIVDNELAQFADEAYVGVWRWHPDSVLFYQVFNFSRLFFTIIVTFISVVLLIVLFFGIQNVFFLSLARRSNEVSVLTTYGMPFTKIYRLIFWETVVYFAIGLSIGFMLAIVTGGVLSGINMTQLSDQMVVVLGGPSLQFDFTLRDILLVILFMSLSGLYASIHSLRKYFKMEIREMKAGIQ